MPGSPRCSRLLVAALALAALAALTSTAPVATASPAASTRAAAPLPPAALAGVAVDEAAPYQPQVSCDPTAKPGVLATRDLVLASFGGGSGAITRACSRTSTSEHQEGRAWDWVVDARSAPDRRRVRAALRWLLAPGPDGESAVVARRLGIMYLIWNRRMWSPWSGWKRYTGASPHRDHVHVSFTWNGATGATSWWTGAPQPTDHGPCRVRADRPAPAWTAPNYLPCPTPAAGRRRR